MKQSKFLSLKQRDALRGFIVAVLTPVLYLLQELIPHYNIHVVLKVALSGGIAYLIKNFFTKPDNHQNEIKKFTEEDLGGSSGNSKKDEK